MASALPRKLGPSLIAAALAAAFSLVFAFLGVVGASSVFGSVALSPIVALSCALSVVVVAWLGSRSHRGAPRGRAAGAMRPASWALFAWVPYLFVGPVYDLGNPIVLAHWRCGTGDIGLFVVVLGSVPVVFATGILVAAAADRFELARSTRVVSALLLGAALVALVASARRAHKHERDDYLATLPVVAELSHHDNDPRLDRFEGPGFTIEETALAQAADTASGCVLSSPTTTSRQELAPSCEGMQVLRDAEHDLWVLRARTEAGGSTYSALDGRSPGSKTDISVRRVASSMKPPGAWTASLAFGSLISAVLVAAAVAMGLRVRAWRSARPGLHGEGGWVTFQDGTPPGHFAAAAALPAGPVLVREGAPPRAGYREHGGAGEGAKISAGTLEDLAAAARVRASALYAFAGMVAALTLAPMAAAALNGLLG